jgi:lipoprotein-anchoring transpeptidase ErfK/SrfK
VALFSTKNLKKLFITQVILLAVLAMLIFGWWIYVQNQEILARITPNENVTGKQKMLLEFSHEMIESSIDENITIEPAVDFRSKWKDNQKLELTIEDYLSPEQEFKILITGARAKRMIFAKNIEGHFYSSVFPKLEKNYPEDGMKDVDYSEAIVFDFNRPLNEDMFFKFQADPSSGFEAKLNEVKNKLTVVPKEGLAKRTKYLISLEVKHRYSDELRNLYQGSFETKTPPQVVYNLDQNGDPAKTEDREEEVIAQIKTGKCLDIDISSQSLFLFQDGKELGAYKVSTGLRGMDTPQGTFKVMAKSRRPWSAKYKLYMPWFIQFTNQGHGIHELPEWPGGYKEGANHLGIPVSHGCVRLGIGPAKVVYDFAEVGTPIVIHW